MFRPRRRRDPPRRRYNVATTPRLARAVFLGSEAPRGAAEVIVDAADGPALPALLRNLVVDADRLGEGTPSLAPDVLRRLANPGGPLTRNGLEPDGRGRLTLLGAAAAVRRWGFEASATPAEALGGVIAGMSPEDRAKVERRLAR